MASRGPKNKANVKRTSLLEATLEEGLRRRGLSLAEFFEVRWQASNKQHISLVIRFSIDGEVIVVGGAACSPGDMRSDSNFVSKVLRRIEDSLEAAAGPAAAPPAGRVAASRRRGFLPKKRGDG